MVLAFELLVGAGVGNEAVAVGHLYLRESFFVELECVGDDAVPVEEQCSK